MPTYPRRRARTSEALELRDTIQPYPTFSEIYVAALKSLRGKTAGSSEPIAAGRNRVEAS